MRCGDRVKVLKRDVARFGEIGVLREKQMTVFGICWEVEFDDGTGLYEESKLKKVED